jgi:surface antigen
MTKRLDPASLDAYVDGQLDAAGMSQTAELLLGDPEALARVRAMQQDSALLRAAYRGAAEAPVPPMLLAAIDRGFAARRRAGGGFRGYAAAAAVALAVVGSLAGYLVGDYRARSAAEAVATRAAADQRVLTAAIEQALEEKASGQRVAWHNPDSGAYGEVVPVRTYRSKSNHWCREYVASKVSDGTEEKIRAIACRADDGDWVKVEQLYHDS